MRKTILARAAFVTFGLAAVVACLPKNTSTSSVERTRNSEINLREIELSSFGKQQGSSGNIIGIQPTLSANDFRSAEALEKALQPYFDKADRANLLKKNTVVSLPEYVGTYLVLADEAEQVYREEKIASAMQKLILTLRNAPGFAASLTVGSAEDKMKEALFRTKSDAMAENYRVVMSNLAKKNKVTLIGGSTFLPDPVVAENKIHVDKGNLKKKTSLKSVVFLFHPDGTVDDNFVGKVHLTKDEHKFAQTSPLKGLHVYDLPVGRVAPVICADSWYPDVYDALEKKKVEIIVTGSYSAPTDFWKTPWKGFDGSDIPRDVKNEVKADIGNITEGMAWEKYTLHRRAPGAGAVVALTTFLRGSVYETGSDGYPIVVSGNEHTTGKKDAAAQIVNIWVPRNR